MSHTREEKMFENLTIEEYNGILASKAPTPGGGSALAQVAAIACSLAEMAINVTTAKLAETDENYVYLRSQGEVIARAKRALYKLSNDDAQAFERIVEALRLPKTTADEQKRRSNELQKAYHRAALVPIDVMGLCREILRLSKVRILPYLSKYVSSDCVIAMDLCKTVAKSCLVNVHANTALISDPTLKNSLEKQATAILDEINKI